MYDPNFIAFGISWYLVFVISVTLHEAAHAYAAMKLGDTTAYLGGQVSLNPIPHIEREPIGMIVVPIISYISFGWVMGWASAPFDRFWAERHPKKAALMALAGPLSNLLLVVLSVLAVHIGIQLGCFVNPERISSFTDFVAPSGNVAIYRAMATTLSMFFFLNILFFIFNLLPLPPLDGSSVIQFFMSKETAQRYQQIMYDPNYSLFGLVLAWILFDQYISKHIFWICVKILYPHITYS